MDSLNASNVNIVVWAESRDKAVELATAFTAGTETNEEWKGNFNGSALSAYIRHPGGFIQASPKNNTDILIIQLSSKDSEFAGEAEKYMSQRKGIPFKFVVSGEDLSEWAKEHGAEFIQAADITSDANKQKIVKSVGELEETLKKAFEGLDLNKNGFITADELVQASAALGHQLNSEEAKLVANALSTDGNISFPKFKSWWVMGRGDLNTFRRLIQVEVSVGGLLKKSSELFNNYMTGLQSQPTGNDTYNGRINIGPTEDFESGIGMDIDFCAGKECEEILNSLPDYFRSSPICYGFELKTNDEAAGAALKQTLEGLLEMFGGAIPQLQMALAMGIQINFRNVGSSVFIDLSFGGMIADQVQSKLGEFNFEQVNFAGIGSSSIFSGLKVTDLVKSSFEEIVGKLCQFKIEGHSEFSGLKVLSYALSTLYEGMSSNIPRKLRPLFSLIKIIAAFRSLGYEFKYDSKEFTEVVHDIIASFGASSLDLPADEVKQAIGGQLSNFQAMGDTTIEAYKPMAEPFLEPYKAVLSSLNFDNYSVFITFPKLRVYYKSNFHLTGLNAFVNEKLLN